MIAAGEDVCVSWSESRAALRCFVLALLLLNSPPVGACPLPAGASAALADVTPAARLAFLRESLAREGRRVHTWSTLWVGANILLMAGAAGALPFYSAANRAQLYVGIGATVVGSLPLVLVPPAVQRDGPYFESRILTAAPDVDICALISEGERLLVSDAGQENAILGPVSTVINAVYNIGVALVLGLGFHQWASGAQTLLTGFTIGQVVMYTQPRALPTRLDDYLAGHPNLTDRGLSLHLGPQEGGLGLNLTF